MHTNLGLYIYNTATASNATHVRYIRYHDPVTYMLVSFIIAPCYFVQTGRFSTATDPIQAALEINIPRSLQPDGLFFRNWVNKVPKTLELITSFQL